MSNDKMEVPEFWEGTVYVKMDIMGIFAGEISISQYDGRHGGDSVVLHSQDMRIDIPRGVDVRGKAVDALKDEKAKILAGAHIAAAAVQHKIDDLLQISYEEVEPEALTND